MRCVGSVAGLRGYISPLSPITATFGFYICLFVPFYLVTHRTWRNLWTGAPTPAASLIQPDLFSCCYCHMTSTGVFTFLSLPTKIFQSSSLHALLTWSCFGKFLKFGPTRAGFMVSLPSEPLASPAKLWVDLCVRSYHWGVCALLISSLFSEMEVGAHSFSEWSNTSNQIKRPHQGKEGALKFDLKTLSPCMCLVLRPGGVGAKPEI